MMRGLRGERESGDAAAAAVSRGDEMFGVYVC